MSEHILKSVTEQSLKTSFNLDTVITPDAYKKIFLEFCKLENISYRECKDRDFTKESLVKLEKLLDSTKRGVIELKSKTDRVSEALKSRDLDTILELEIEIDSLQKKLNLLERELYIDELTKCYNRKWLYDKKLNQNQTFKRDGIFALIDLNDFKAINDTYGHITGDKVLRVVVDFFKSYIEEVVRYGGDEFLLFLEQGRDLNSVKSLLSRAQKSLSNKKLSYSNHIFNISFSFGAIDFKFGDNFLDKLEAVDSLMYKNKKSRFQF